jgi:Cu-Zn family superoxide dismutase
MEYARSQTDRLTHRRLKGDAMINLRLSLTLVFSSLFAALLFTAAARADTATATVNSITATGVGAQLGTITFADTDGGLQITPKLSGMPPGEHGLHIHEKGNCGPGTSEGKPAAGFAAGGHYDPGHTKKHLGPMSTEGHRGDLPVLMVDKSGNATQSVTAPHLKVADITGRSIMIHAGGDNYSDTPKPLGGGGARIACGVIK